MSKKIVKIIGYVVFALSALVILHFYIADMGKLSDGLAATEDMPSEMKVAAMGELGLGWGGLILNFSGILFALCAIAVVGFVIYFFVVNTIDSPKSAIKPLIILVGTGLVILISYSLASDEIPKFLGDSSIQVTASTSKWIDTFLYVTYFVFGLTIFMSIYAAMSKIWK